MRDGHGRIRAVIRMMMHFRSDGPLDLQALHVHQLLMRMTLPRRNEYESALKEYIEHSEATTPCFFEAGGWAIDSNARSRSVAIVVLAANWSLCRAIGGAKGIGALTTRHNAAAIAKRFGGFEIRSGKKATLGQFFDPYYQCDMEILGVSSDRLNSIYEATVLDIQRGFDKLAVFTA
jgi:hypothetical protein